MQSQRSSVALGSKAEMDSIASKRDWIYSGLAHPSNVILANRPRGSRLPAGTRILLAGDESAAGLGPFLGKLAVDSKVNLRFEWERAALAEHWLSVATAERLKKTNSSVVVASFTTKETDPASLSRRLREFKQSLNPSMLVWILPLVRNASSEALSMALPVADISAFHSDLLEVHRSPTGAPSARGYAGWAGSVWNWLK
jgi:hypothetical protein